MQSLLFHGFWKINVFYYVYSYIKLMYLSDVIQILFQKLYKIK